MEPLDHVPREFFAGAGSTEPAGVGSLKSVSSGANRADSSGANRAASSSVTETGTPRTAAGADSLSAEPYGTKPKRPHVRIFSKGKTHPRSSPLPPYPR